MLHFLFYINSIRIRISYRPIPIKGYSFIKSSLYRLFAQGAGQAATLFNNLDLDEQLTKVTFLWCRW